MNSYQFFWHVANLRLAEKLAEHGNEDEYKRARLLRWELDREILRVEQIVAARGAAIEVDVRDLAAVIKKFKQECEKDKK